ncbi:hypothetical protein [Lentzea sp. E54]|uniref:hypothetical protein n=1 Tax=Lentzea xerophila TaxID=3435883 RepID=UPI003DA1C957
MSHCKGLVAGAELCQTGFVAVTQELIARRCAVTRRSVDRLARPLDLCFAVYLPR